MCAAGASPWDPSLSQVARWGASFGPWIAHRGEAWRFLAPMFVHGGFLHLLFNMWCLVRIGPIAERLFGSPGFLAAYLLSGVGGTLASVAVHPHAFGVGASGAVFGVFGMLVAFLLVQGRAIPRLLVRPMLVSAVVIAAINLVSGFSSPEVDNAAHVGGLAAGFAAGLLLQRRWPPDVSHPGRVRRTLGGAALAGLLGLAGLAVASDLRKEADWARLTPESMARIDDFEAFQDAFAEASQDMAQIHNELVSELRKDREDEQDWKRLGALAGRLKAQARLNQSRAALAAAPDGPLRPVRDELAAAQAAQVRALESLEKACRSPVGRLLGLPAFHRALQQFEEHHEAFSAGYEAFLHDSGLDLLLEQVEGEDPGIETD
jgi:rhomboid protease GluP